jgi:outer membrane protein assembly factor BamB
MSRSPAHSHTRAQSWQHGVFAAAVAAAVVLAGAWLTVPEVPTVNAQAADGLVHNPEVFLPAARVNDDIMASLRRARNAELEAETLAAEGKEEEALERWRDAFGRYEHLRREHLREDLTRNAEPMVRADWLDSPNASRVGIFAESWQPLGDYINSRQRTADWPRMFRDRLVQRQSGPGAALLESALRNDSEDDLRRCARLYQFSPAGRQALRLLAQRALERGDAVMAVRWLEDLRQAWPEHFDRNPALHVQYVRACRDAGMHYRVGRMLTRLERMGLSGEVDVAGTKHDSRHVLERLASEGSPQDRPELRPPGWLTQLGSADRNGVGAPFGSVDSMLGLVAEDEPKGREIGLTITGGRAQPDQFGRRQQSANVPMVYPTVHESGVFVHRLDQSGNTPGSLYWFRHGHETAPLELEIPGNRRYSYGSGSSSSGGVIFWSSSSQTVRDQYDVHGSTVGRLRWDQDNREGDVLFAVLGEGQPNPERPSSPTGNQIQAWNLTDDAALLMTLPNQRLEEQQEFDSFLRHVVFRGAPVVRDNRLYIAGVMTERSSFETWLFCFDVTPKGDAAAGGGKLLWRTHLGSRAMDHQRFGRGRNVEVPPVSSPAESGGMLFVSSHNGFTAAVEAVSGELAWVSRYGRPAQSPSAQWVPNAPLVTSGLLVTAPYDFDLALVLDTVRGTQWMEYPIGRKGHVGEYEHVLGAVDGHLVIQGRTRLHCVSLPKFRQGGVRHADYGRLLYETTEFHSTPTGRGLIADNKVLVPMEAGIAVYDVRTGKLLSTEPLPGLHADSLPATLTLYSRGEAYEDEEGQTRYHAATLTDPETGNVYNVEHLRNGDTFTFPGTDRSAVVRKETFLVHATARWMHVYRVDDANE